MNVQPGVKGFVPVSLENRFWAKVIQSDGCWSWTGAVRNKQRPYGTIYVNGKTRAASQISWEIFRGEPWPSEMDACHICDNPNCVNPLHIFPGTPSMNALDAYAKGRIKAPNQRHRWTHCMHGHEFTEANTIVRGHQRECRACKTLRNSRRCRKIDRAALAATGDKHD